MERSLFRYIWSYTRREQIWIVIVTLFAMIPYYMSFDLPKQIINGPISGIGYSSEGDTLPFLRVAFDLPVIGSITVYPGIELERIPMLFALGFAYLALVIINGVIKIYINIYKGRLGERLLRRIRFDLVDRILRFPPRRFKSLKAGEVASMVKDEVEPFGGFSGEAFASPVMLVGQTFTAMLFIFVQLVGLGMVALVMALIQVLVIPKLRARLIVLGRERQLKARHLAGRVAEIVDGIDTIRGGDATNYVRADMVDRLGRIFKIRYDIYQWKFFVKFLNNTIAHMTPFIFYVFGGYLAIMGRLDVGQLVAVINAYKELPGPMKGLIDYDLARQDIQVKYETIISQFDVGNLIEPELQALDPSTQSLAGKPLQVKALTITDDSGSNALDRVTTRFEQGEAVALVGGGGSGASELAAAIGRIVWPSKGGVLIGETNLLKLPDAVSGRRITYASPNQFFFSGALEDNLLIGLKNAPRVPRAVPEAEAEFQRWWWREAELTGNPVLDVHDGWIDEAAILDHTGAASLGAARDKVLSIVQMRNDIVQLALRSLLDPDRDGDLAEEILELRRSFADELERRGWQDLVLPFDQTIYNDAATVAENIYFGIPIGDDSVRRLGGHDFMREIVSDAELGRALYASGRVIAQTSVGLFQDLPPEHPYFERMHLFRPDELPELAALLDRTEGLDFDAVERGDRQRLIWLNGNYSEPWYRFGALTEALRAKIVEVRKRVRRELPEELSGLIEFYDSGRYMFRADIRQNITFGNPNPQIIDAGARLAEVGMALRDKHREVIDQILKLGMTYEVGPGGRRLSSLQKTKLNLARALLRDSDIYVFNSPLLGVDEAQQREIMRDTIAFLRKGDTPPLILWVLSDPAMTEAFDRVLTFSRGSIRSDRRTGVGRV